VENKNGRMEKEIRETYCWKKITACPPAGKKFFSCDFFERLRNF
jgi:hypothetical protein